MDKLDDMLSVVKSPMGGPADLVPLVEELVSRLKATEAALDEINEGWRYGGHFHCNCAACGD